MRKTKLPAVLNPITLSLMVLAVLLTPCTTVAPAYASHTCVYAPLSSYQADDDQQTLPVMKFTREQRREQHNKFIKAAIAKIDEAIQKKLAARTSFTSINNLSRVPGYNARNQGSAGNCWVWAGTAAMEAELYNQLGTSTRLSIQYFDSNYDNGAAGNWAGCGGNMWGFADFYNTQKIAVPWSNTNASYQDGSRTCGTGTAVVASSISTSPSYTIRSSTTSAISTFSVNQSTAVANIKNVLNQGKVAVFCYFLSDSDWSAFRSFWRNQPEAMPWSGGFSCGTATSDGHGVACVGYNDDSTDTSQHYWIMLNSWGTTTGRPNGLFRVPIYYNYQCVDSDGWANTYWYTINTIYTQVAVPAAPTLSSPSSGSSFSGPSVTFQWSPLPGATQYRLQVNADASFTGTDLYNSIVAGTTQSVSGFANKGNTFYWRVYAGSADGQWGAASSVFNFINGNSLSLNHEIGIFRPTHPLWALDYNGNGAWDTGIDRVYGFAAPGDSPVTGNWNGIGKTEIGIYRPSNQLWALDYNGNGAWDPGIDKVYAYGAPGDIPVTGDWNSDGKSEIGIFRPSGQLWALDYNGNGAWDSGIDKVFSFGIPGDIPITGDWNGDGKTKIGVFRPSENMWYLDYNGDGVFTPGFDIVLGPFGVNNDTPAVGAW